MTRERDNSCLENLNPYHDLIYKVTIPSKDIDNPTPIANIYLNRRAHSTKSGIVAPIGLEIEFLDIGNISWDRLISENSKILKDEFKYGISQALYELAVFAEDRWQISKGELSKESMLKNQQVFEFANPFNKSRSFRENISRFCGALVFYCENIEEFDKGIYKPEAIIRTPDIDLAYFPIFISSKHENASVGDIITNLTDWFYDLNIDEKYPKESNRPHAIKGRLYKKSHGLPLKISAHVSQRPIRLKIGRSYEEIYILSDPAETSKTGPLDENTTRIKPVWEIKISKDNIEPHSVRAARISLLLPSSSTDDEQPSIILELRQIEGVENIWEKVITGNYIETSILKEHILLGLQQAVKKLEKINSKVKKSRQETKLKHYRIIIDWEQNSFLYSSDDIAKEATKEGFVFKRDRFKRRNLITSKHSMVEGSLYPRRTKLS